MARIRYARAAIADFERIVDFLRATEPESAPLVVDLIRRAVIVLATSPYVGRSVEHGLRELVISRGRTGYVALYRFNRQTDSVLVLALRHQREAGYDDEQ